MKNFVLFRKPIFSVDLDVFAYELIFRTSPKDFSFFSKEEFKEDVEDFPTLEDLESSGYTEKDKGTIIGINNIFSLIGLKKAINNKRGLIKFTKNLLKSDFIYTLPKNYIGILIEQYLSKDVDDEYRIAVNRLHNSGYIIVLDNFNFSGLASPLLAAANMVKIDFLRNSEDEIKNILTTVFDYGIEAIADNLNSREDFEKAKSLSFSLFSGNFFSRPLIIAAKDIEGNKLNYLQILKEIHSPELDYKKLEDIIKRDLALSYKLLKYINSAFFGLTREIDSIKTALVLLGDKEIKRWVTVTIFATLASDKPSEVLRLSLLRAKFAELLAEKLGFSDMKEKFFLMGLFSLIDVILDKPKEEILGDIPLDDEIKNALIKNSKNEYGVVLNIILLYEEQKIDVLEEILNGTNISLDDVSQYYISSLEWADEAFKATQE